MVYVARDGTLRDGPKPWGVDRLKETFWSFVSSVELFFLTLLPIARSDRSVGYRSSGGSSSSSGRGPRSNQPRGGFRTMSDIAPPPMAGGCAGGRCGM